MALYRFLFAPVLLAVAVLTTSPRRPAQPAHAEPAGAAASHEAGTARPARPGDAPRTPARADSSRPSTVP